MVIEIKHQICNGHMLKWLAAAGLAWLEHNQHTVNRMNVFPVPDGDTGTNMLLTMRKACEGLAYLNEEHVGVVAEAIAQGALMGARGNSGVILSQLWRGFAAGIREQPVFDARLFARACELAVDAAYKAVVQPVEGTILTVAREATEAVVARAANESDLTDILAVMVATAHAALQRTPDLLPVLKEAGVVDSGGMGLVFILEGMLRFIRGEEVELKMQSDEILANGHHWQQALVPEDEAGYGYDVQFLMHGANLDVAAVRAAIDAMGWSTLVVGDERLIKVHVHVHDPGQPLSYAIGLGAALDDVVVENMQQQYESYVEKRIARETGTSAPVDGVAVIAVASGDGLRRLFLEDLGAAYVVSGGQTMNPSTEDFLAAIDSLPHSDIVLLPNNKNILLAAKQAASLSHGKRVQVVPSRTLPQGINAMVAYANLRDSHDFEAVHGAMQAALTEIVSGEVTTATRDAVVDGLEVREGQFIGLLDGKLVVTADTVTEAVVVLLRKAHADECELITLYYGGDVTEDQAQGLADTLSSDFTKQDVITVDGGQPLYPYIISIE
jgi:uncharacterized protein